MAIHAPRVNDDDGAMWRRILRIPFERIVSPEKRDPTVKQRLRNPAESGPAILAWAVAGCLAWQDDGLQIPDSVAQATAAYRSAEDVLGLFTEERCDTDPRHYCGFSDLYTAYRRWCDGAGEKLMTQTAFGRRLEERGFKRDRLPGSRRVIRRGISLRRSDGLANNAEGDE